MFSNSGEYKRLFSGFVFLRLLENCGKGVLAVAGHDAVGRGFVILIEHGVDQPRFFVPG